MKPAPPVIRIFLTPSAFVASCKFGMVLSIWLPVSLPTIRR
jgi:hypothetical protein